MVSASRKKALLPAFALAAAVTAGACGGSISGDMSYSRLLKEAEKGNVQAATIEGNIITVDRASNIFGNSSGKSLTVVVPPNTDAAKALNEAGVDVSSKVPDGSGQWIGLLLPVAIMMGFWFFMMNRMNGLGGGRGKGSPFSFAKSPAKALTENHQRRTFKDVAGVEEAKEEVSEIVDFLKNPGKYQKLGARIPKGVLLMGPPGTGKTLLARAVAGEANVPFFSISGSDFVEMFVGVGAARVRDMFEQGKKNAPCIIFIDEIDAVGRHRGAGLGGGHDEREQTLNQILTEMDGFDGNSGVIIMAATNRSDVLDPALVRPGRFDRQVVVGLPDAHGREQILRVHARNKPLADDVDLASIARGAYGFSGADLENLMNEAALNAARENRAKITRDDLEDAKDKKVMGGKALKSRILSEKEREIIAWHEAGHAIIGDYQPGSDPVHKVTIIGRGGAGGYTESRPDEERMLYSRGYLEAILTQLPGGRIAEEMLLGKDKFTTGASNDIEKFTEITGRMVKQWAMGEKLGFFKYGANEREVFLGRQITETQNMSEDTSRQVDQEIRRIGAQAYERARTILEEHAEELRNMAQALLKYEILTGRAEIDAAKTGDWAKLDELRKPKEAAAAPPARPQTPQPPGP